MMNPLAILASAQRCNASYIENLADVTKAFYDLGMSVMAQYQNLTHQAILSRDTKGWLYLTIAGTRFSEGHNLDLLDDIWLAPVKAPKGGAVASGVYQGMGEFWRWVLATIPAGSPLNVEGHSLGAERVLLTPIFLPDVQIGELYAFEAPQTGTQAYWDAYRSELSGAVHTVCGADLWYNWPPRQGYVHDAQSNVLWFQNSPTVKVIKPSDWPIGSSAPDHEITEVIARIQASIAAGTFPH